ncbi:hypothetical protein SADUNF_Sadunf17G0070300 [Salix dunnii]|uniref:DCD domain-containing protein n=1 Tax=Salix dunnii TaxID=1413687 RepID=A0A835MEW5_9ROSI|nr:hypothetical protein SADUNF_Sadunf17G0070300 [Salix dunnii]
MESLHSFWQLGDELRGQSKVSEDQMRPRDKIGFQEENKFECFNFNMMNLDSKMTENGNKSYLKNNAYNMNAVYQKNKINSIGNLTGSKYSGNNPSSKYPSNHSNNNINNDNYNTVDKRFKTLPAAETLPRNECPYDLEVCPLLATFVESYLIIVAHLICLPPRYRDSVRAITPGLPLFLYNYSTHQLLTFLRQQVLGGTNIDPTAWEDKKCKGESRKLCEALEEDTFRLVLHHYDGPKFCLELSTLDLLGLCEQAGSSA